jgi:limonene-1,2-epoxide hydrolase
VEPTEVVEAFLAALEATDIDGALALVDPAIVYQNVPLPPARGLAAFEKQMRYLETFFTGFEAQIHHIAAEGGTVLTERTDALARGPVRAAFWVDGTFEVVDGRITVWRDRFDWVTVIGATLAALARAAFGALTRKADG